MHEQDIIDHILSRLDTSQCKVHAVSLICTGEALQKRLQRDVDMGIRKADVVLRSLGEGASVWSIGHGQDWCIWYSAGTGSGADPEAVGRGKEMYDGRDRCPRIGQCNIKVLYEGVFMPGKVSRALPRRAGLYGRHLVKRAVWHRRQVNCGFVRKARQRFHKHIA